MKLLQWPATGLPATLLLAAAVVLSVLAAQPLVVAQEMPAAALSDANAALQAGEADKALALLDALLGADSNLAEAHNLECRVHLTLEHWDAAARECQQAVGLDEQNSDYHLWLGRALGHEADKASFLTAYSLAKKAREEFEEAVRLNPRNVGALSDLGNFYQQAPGIVGGGIEKAEGIAAQLDKVEIARAHELRGRIAEQRKDYGTAEREFRQSAATSAHPALMLTTLAGYYGRRKRFPELEAAVRSAYGSALRDRHAAVALYDGAGVLTESNRDPALAAKMLEDYIASPAKTEEAPAFSAHIRLAQLRVQLGNPAAASRELAAALALAHGYRPAQDFSSQVARQQ
jgi:tetratricopeptide (TPR) repeat protein